MSAIFHSSSINLLLSGYFGGAGLKSCTAGKIPAFLKRSHGKEKPADSPGIMRAAQRDFLQIAEKIRRSGSV
ncbi:hypothetical protein [Planococcus lenghuensis]|uniref:Uncharacterized protein n=1 Tax=Planococcus lenghuensis TaxID=2213202 RepID=A0A1Q2L4J0_9BACL|nr:hypothetical protein [Planococcus lenghuensis]AQQ54782.1 hypothetical protein B0X71_17850 [Planococcus lenghuensis]